MGYGRRFSIALVAAIGAAALAYAHSAGEKEGAGTLVSIWEHQILTLNPSRNLANLKASSGRCQRSPLLGKSLPSSFRFRPCMELNSRNFLHQFVSTFLSRLRAQDSPPSRIPNFVLAFIPAEINANTLNTMTAFATGGLLSDVFLHLIPACIHGLRVLGGDEEGGHSHSHSHSHQAPVQSSALQASGVEKERAKWPQESKRKQELNGETNDAATLNLTNSILIRSGFTKKQAMQSQFLTAIGAFVTTATGVEHPAVDLAAGGCGKTPRDYWEQPHNFLLTESKGAKQALREFAAMAFGVLCMFLVA
ncbi:Zinc/iron permease [Coprinopsis sp. MPI-PUGE-AT-0042]|nr:Zinc/iron permease [Coprinopsis sp. MPI-PUGE-AT-0042]